MEKGPGCVVCAWEETGLANMGEDRSVRKEIEHVAESAAPIGCGLGCAVSMKNIACSPQTILARMHCETCCNLLQAVGCMYCVWDFASDVVGYSPNWNDALGRWGEAGGLRASLEAKGARRSALGRVLRRIAGGCYAAARCRLTAAGKAVWYRCAAEPILDGAGKALGAVVAFTDITREKEALRRLFCRTQRDSLTGLHNKWSTQRLIAAALAKGPGALLFVDIDNFKWINDSRGHLAGDLVLRCFGAVLRGFLAPGDVAGRVGGDEFMLFLHGVAERAVLAARIEALVEALEHCCKGELCLLTVSVGAVLCGAAQRDFFALYDRADRALYQAKRRGKNCFVVWEAEG